MRPTIKGRSLEIIRTDVDNYQIKLKIKEYISKKSFKDINQLDAFLLETKKVQRSSFNIFYQPDDNVWLTSKYFPLPNSKGGFSDTILISKKWNKTVNSHNINVK